MNETEDQITALTGRSTYDNVDDEIENYNFDNSNDIENYCPRGDEVILLVDDFNIE
jgi:hypothetical protein